MIRPTPHDIGRRVKHWCAGMETPREGTLRYIADIRSYCFVLFDGEKRSELTPQTHLDWIDQ